MSSEFEQDRVRVRNVNAGVKTLLKTDEDSDVGMIVYYDPGSLRVPGKAHVMFDGSVYEIHPFGLAPFVKVNEDV